MHFACYIKNNSKNMYSSSKTSQVTYPEFMEKITGLHVNK